mgnify:CR=1 FL=1
MLIKGFYKIQSISLTKDDAIHVTIQLNKDHSVFKGHFPNNPITPGVCLIQIIKEITEEHVKKKLFLQSISNIKFTSIINPYFNADLILELFVFQDGSIVKVRNITKFVDDNIALKFNGTFIKK